MHYKVIDFWFAEIKPSQRWAKDEAFDRLIANRFGELHRQASDCELYHWRETALGRLAEIIILDQFSRNMYRDTPRAFACDPLALALAQEAVAGGFDSELNPDQKSFLYMPYMHSESRQIHAQAEPLFESLGIESTLKFERKHRAIIERFGRYPHRNRILGRVSSAEEEAFLKLPGSGF
ncbi:MAG: DUF924 domain-containing protein [Gammaproteobacteria bacterium]|nr:DUF924 domain-containing protein [Gammaproteobacteria bacterium]